VLSGKILRSGLPSGNELHRLRDVPLRAHQRFPAVKLDRTCQ
jgi:hypothetical protein